MACSLQAGRQAGRVGAEVGVPRGGDGRLQVDCRFDGQPACGVGLGRVGVVPSTGVDVPQAGSCVLCRARPAGAAIPQFPLAHSSPFVRWIRLLRRLRAAMVALFLRESQILRDNVRMLKFLCEERARRGQTDRGRRSHVHRDVDPQPARRLSRYALGVVPSAGSGCHCASAVRVLPGATAPDNGWLGPRHAPRSSARQVPGDDHGYARASRSDTSRLRLTCCSAASRTRRR